MKAVLNSALVLAILGGIIWWSNRQEDAKKDQRPADAGPQLLSLTEDDIRGIEIERKGEPPTILSRDEGGVWTITSPEKLAADMQAVTAIAANARNLSSERVVDEKPAQLEGYGLQPPEVSLKVTMKDGKTHRVLVGEQTPDKTGAYAMIEGDPKLYTVPAYTRDMYNKSAMDMRDKRLMSFDIDKVARAELNVQGKPPIEFLRAGDQWQIARPRAYRADKLAVQEFLNAIHDAQIDPSMEEKASIAAFNSAKPLASVRLTLDSGPQTLEVRSSGDDYFAKSSKVPSAWKVAPTVGEGLNKTLDDFQNKKLFDFAFDDPSQLDIKIGGDSRIVARSKSKDGSAIWLSNGRTMDSISVQNIIDKLRELSANRIADVNAGPPEIDVTVTSNEGKRVETVRMAPSGPDFLGMRNGEPQFYRIDGSLISDLKTAIAALREAEPTKDLKDSNKK